MLMPNSARLNLSRYLQMIGSRVFTYKSLTMDTKRDGEKFEADILDSHKILVLQHIWLIL